MFKEHIQKQIQRGREARPFLRISQASLAILITLSPALIPVPFAPSRAEQAVSQDTIKNTPDLVTVGWGDPPATLSRIPTHLMEDYGNLDLIRNITSTPGLVRLSDPTLKKNEKKPKAPICQKVSLARDTERIAGITQSARWVTIELKRDNEGKPYTNVCFRFGNHPKDVSLSTAV